MHIHTDGEPDESHVKSKRDPEAKMSTRRYPHMEKGYTNTRRRNDWEPNTEQQEDDPHAHARQEHNKEKEKALELIEAYPEEMLHLSLIHI